MKRINTLVLIALATLFVTSCTVEKRLYNKGFHVQWGTKYKADKKEKVQAESVASIDFNKTHPEEKVLAQSTEIRSASNFSSLEDEIAEIQIDPIQEDSVQTSEKSTASIQPTSHSEKLSFVGEKNSVPEVVKQSTDKAEKNRSKHKQSAGADSTSKSQIVAFILVLLVGILGIHRFYLGYPGIGILMLLTLGCFGILALVDLVRILLGDLKPKHGDYYQKF